MKKLLLILGLILSINITAQNHFKDGDYRFDISNTTDVLTNTRHNNTKCIVLFRSNNSVTFNYYTDSPETYRITRAVKNSDGSMEFTIMKNSFTMLLTVGQRQNGSWVLIASSNNPSIIFMYDVMTVTEIR